MENEGLLTDGDSFEIWGRHAKMVSTTVRRVKVEILRDLRHKVMVMDPEVEG